MAFTNTNDYLTGRAPGVTSDDGDLVAVRYVLHMETGDLAANKIGAVGILPAQCVPVQVLFDSDKLDTNAAPAIAASVGLLNAAGTGFDTTWGAGITTAQAGGQSQVLSQAIAKTAATDTDRLIGVQFTAAAATAAAGDVGVTLLYHSV